MPDQVTAVNEILDLFQGVWDSNYPVAFPNVKPTTSFPPNDNTPWARVLVNHTTGGQAGFGGGSNCYVNEGFIIFQIFVPAGEALTQGYTLRKLVLDAYKNIQTQSGVWFRNHRHNEIGPDGDFFQINALVDFVYNEVN